MVRILTFLGTCRSSQSLAAQVCIDMQDYMNVLQSTLWNYDTCAATWRSLGSLPPTGLCIWRLFWKHNTLCHCRHMDVKICVNLYVRHANMTLYKTAAQISHRISAVVIILLIAVDIVTVTAGKLTQSYYVGMKT